MSAYYYPLIGGTMLASSVYHLLYYNGRVLGISGIYGGTVSTVLGSVRRHFAAIQPAKGETVQSSPENHALLNGGCPTDQKRDVEQAGSSRWKISFVAGLLAGGTLLRFLRAPIEIRLGTPIFEAAALQGISATPLTSLLAGLLVGTGTKLSGGCTSGHMICGVPTLSLRSIVATATFFASAVATVLVLYPKTSTTSISQNPFDPLTILLLQFPLLFYRYIVPTTIPTKWYELVSSFFIAIHFALALALTGMLQPSKVQNFLFLPFSSNFDPALMCVAVGALVPLTLAWAIKLRSTEKPLFNSEFNLSSRKEVDWKLIVGAVIFGLGWGWVGICPGPGVVNFGGYPEEWRTTGAWLLGMTGGRVLISN